LQPRTRLAVPILAESIASCAGLQLRRLSDKSASVEAPNNPEFWNRAAGTSQFTQPLDDARLTRALTTLSA